MSSQSCVVFVDSGKGGLPYFMDYHTHDRSRTLIYIADNAAFPYGTKDSVELCHSLLQTIRRIIERFDPMLIVLACNTASVTALKWLRRRISTPLVGVVPAVKPASAQTTVGKIGLLVTERTAVGDYLHDLIGQFAADRVVITVVANDIVTYVEDNAVSLTVDSSPAIDALIDKALAEFAQFDVDTLVLGCTHFVYIVDLLRKKIDRPMAVIDSRAGVVSRIRQLTKRVPVLQKRHADIPMCYTTSASISLSFGQLLQRCNMIYQGML